MASNLWLTAGIWAFLLAGSFAAWRAAALRARQLEVRFRFFALRDRCVALVASEVVREDDEVFQFFYDSCNDLAADARYLDFRSFVEHITRATLSGRTDSTEIEALMQAVKQRPEEFQKLVKDFYRAIEISLIDSSTTIKLSLCCSRIPVLKQVTEGILLAFVARFAAPEMIRHMLVTRQRLYEAYRRANYVTESLQAA